MPRRWFCCGASRVRRRVRVIAVLAFGVAAPASAATLRERSVQVEIRPDGSVIERTRLTVRLDAEEDLAAWSPYPVSLDEHRVIESFAAFIQRPGGRREELDRRAFDTMEVAGDPGVLHSSRSLRLVRFGFAPVGSLLEIQHVVRERPYFSSGLIPIGGGDATEHLLVEVRGGGASFRWRLDGEEAGLTITPAPGGLTVTATGLPALRPPASSPGSSSVGAVLRYAWGGETGWPEIGRWYADLIGGVPRGTAAVRQAAMSAAGGASSPGERLAAVLEFVRRQVRYVAVEVGIGGLRPSPPAVVLDRGWGDCKDKALLLVDLLAAQGIEAHPALIRADADDRMDRAFPSLDQFNHMIVAVPLSALALAAKAREGLPIAEGLLFVDPTQQTGALRWLHPAIQEQDALVIRGAQSALVATPALSAQEAREIDVEVLIAPDGGASGSVRIVLRGGAGASLLDSGATERPEATEARVRRHLHDAVPGADLESPAWSRVDTEVPGVELRARVGLTDLAPGASRGLVIPSPILTPPVAQLDGRRLPWVLAPGRLRLRWQVALPPGWCIPANQNQGVENAAGRFRQTVVAQGGTVVVEAEAEVKRRWVEGALLTDLRDLALAEQRARRTRIFLDCGKASPTGR